VGECPCRRGFSRASEWTERRGAAGSHDPDEENAGMPARPRPCEICKVLIEPERIEAMPETRLCSEHARKIAKYDGEFIVTATRERLSKTSSLKQNYGSVTTTKTRNTSAIEKLRRDFEQSARHNG
jgi:hypothetical protein